MTDALCKMCRERPAGTRSHIIPRACFADIDTDDGPLYSIPADPAEREKRAPVGTYDTTILCGTCERRFQSYDDHGVWSLRQEPVLNDRWGNPRVAELPGADAVHLKLFFMHVLWRAYESVRPEFRSVDLGPRAAPLRALPLADDPGPPDQFGVILVRYAPDPDDLHNMIQEPAGSRWADGARLTRFLIRNWVPTVTTSSTGVPKDMLPVALTPGRPVPLVDAGKPYRDGREIQDAIRIMLGRP